jgi:hypothetical protein
LTSKAVKEVYHLEDGPEKKHSRVLSI